MSLETNYKKLWEAFNLDIACLHASQTPENKKKFGKKIEQLEQETRDKLSQMAKMAKIANQLTHLQEIQRAQAQATKKMAAFDQQYKKADQAANRHFAQPQPTPKASPQQPQPTPNATPKQPQPAPNAAPKKPAKSYEQLTEEFNQDVQYINLLTKKEHQRDGHSEYKGHKYSNAQIIKLYQAARKTFKQLDQLAKLPSATEKIKNAHAVTQRKMALVNQKPLFTHLQQRVVQASQRTVPTIPPNIPPKQPKPSQPLSSQYQPYYLPTQQPMPGLYPRGVPVAQAVSQPGFNFGPQATQHAGTGIWNQNSTHCFFSSVMQLIARTPALQEALTENHLIRTQFLPEYETAAQLGETFLRIARYRTDLLASLAPRFRRGTHDADAALRTIMGAEANTNQEASIFNQYNDKGNIVRESILPLYRAPAQTGNNDLESRLDNELSAKKFTRPPEQFMFALQRSNTNLGNQFVLQNASTRQNVTFTANPQLTTTITQMLQEEPVSLGYQISKNETVVSITTENYGNLYFKITHIPEKRSLFSRTTPAHNKLSLLTEAQFNQQKPPEAFPQEFYFRAQRQQVRENRVTPLNIPLRFTMKGSYTQGGAADTPFEITRFISRPSAGHYVAYVKEQNGTWTCYNDSYVRRHIPEAEAQGVLNAQGYVVYSERVGAAPLPPRPHQEIDEGKVSHRQSEHVPSGPFAPSAPPPQVPFRNKQSMEDTGWEHLYDTSQSLMNTETTFSKASLAQQKSTIQALYGQLEKDWDRDFVLEWNNETINNIDALKTKVAHLKLSPIEEYRLLNNLHQGVLSPLTKLGIQRAENFTSDEWICRFKTDQSTGKKVEVKISTNNGSLHVSCDMNWSLIKGKFDDSNQNHVIYNAHSKTTVDIKQNLVRIETYPLPL